MAWQPEFGGRFVLARVFIFSQTFCMSRIYKGTIKKRIYKSMTKTHVLSEKYGYMVSITHACIADQNLSNQGKHVNLDLQIGGRGIRDLLEKVSVEIT